MGSQNYFIRQNVTQEEVDQIYVGVHNYFSIKLHHGGTFTKFPDVKYQKGKLTYVDLIDIDKFSVHVMEDVMYDLGYGQEMDNEIPICYHYLVPNEGLDFRLRALGNDADVIRFSKYVGECKLFNVYTEHGKTNLHTYFCSPSKVRLEVIDNNGEVDVLDTGKKVCSKLLLCWAETGSSSGSGYCNEANIDKQMGNIEPEPSIVYQPTFEPTTYVPELNYDELETFDPFEGNIEEHMGEEQEDEEEEDEEGDEETIEEGDEETSEEGGDEISEEGVEEISEQRRHKKVSKEGDVDYIVDEENKMDDVAVDMTDFRLNVDGDVVEDEVLGDAFDVEMMDNELFDSAGESDDNETSVRKRKLRAIRQQNHKSDGFYVGQVFENKQAVKKMLTSNIVSTRRNIKTIKDDKGRLQVKCKGSMPTFDVNKDGIHIPSQQRAESSNNSKDKGSMVKNKGGRGKMTNPSLYSCTWVLYVSKNTSSWTWFLKCLGDDLDLTERSNFTFVSDRQKGIIQALEKHWSRSHFSDLLICVWMKKTDEENEGGEGRRQLKKEKRICVLGDYIGGKKTNGWLEENEGVTLGFQIGLHAPSSLPSVSWTVDGYICNRDGKVYKEKLAGVCGGFLGGDVNFVSQLLPISLCFRFFDCMQICSLLVYLKFSFGSMMLS
ncbi:hypothetical protein QVD17_17142 [Tagetes erecta]|uniref:PB1-like domain-containing protein n=1 Tax=Tagetes erecta TaxID=13708 RepID=A0AAD8NU26_TARER|nr:hypothetical protein QVD17_17142 [Tagetes erecta]